MNVKLYAKEHLYLFAYPIYSIGHIIKNFPPIRGTRRLINKRHHKHNVEKMVTNIIVTDGKKDFQSLMMDLQESNLLIKEKHT